MSERPDYKKQAQEYFKSLPQQKPFRPNETKDQFVQRQKAAGYNVASTKGNVSEDPVFGKGLDRVAEATALLSGIGGSVGAMRAAEAALPFERYAPGLAEKVAKKGYQPGYHLSVDTNAGLADKAEGWSPRLLDVMHQDTLQQGERAAKAAKTAARNAETNVVRGSVQVTPSAPPVPPPPPDMVEEFLKKMAGI